VLELLGGGEQSAGELASVFSVSRPAVSRHLRVLREAGLVRWRDEGQRRIYMLDSDGLGERERWLSQFWTGALDRLEHHLDREG
jgi:DNA-binding transcriptional ArsR family regulator